MITNFDHSTSYNELIRIQNKLETEIKDLNSANLDNNREIRKDRILIHTIDQFIARYHMNNIEKEFI